MLAVCVDRSEVYACVTHPSYKALGHVCSYFFLRFANGSLTAFSTNKGLGFRVRLKPCQCNVNVANRSDVLAAGFDRTTYFIGQLCLVRKRHANRVCYSQAWLRWHRAIVRLDELSCKTFKPTTGINAGITEMNRVNRKFRANTI
jgi:hypothetical protein